MYIIQKFQPTRYNSGISSFVSVHFQLDEANEVCDRLNECYKKKHPRSKNKRYSVHSYSSDCKRYHSIVMDRLFKQIILLKKKVKELQIKTKENL